MSTDDHPTQTFGATIAYITPSVNFPARLRRGKARFLGAPT
ncbi:hypothetical protein LJR030_003065 [Rhizobium sp. LjRoot30]